MSNRETLLFFVQKHIGKPYKYGAKTYEAPQRFDCSSFVQYLFLRIGIQLPRTALDQASCGKNIDPKNDMLLPGDLFFIKGGWGHYNPKYPGGIGHVGMYIGADKLINARSIEYKGKENGSVLIEPLESFLTRPDFITARRIIDVE